MRVVLAARAYSAWVASAARAEIALTQVAWVEVIAGRVRSLLH